MLREARHAGASRPGQTGTMAGIVVVDDPSDPRLADYARLTDVRLRSSMEPARGLFVAEGDKVIRRAVAAGYQGRSMLVTRDKLGGLEGVAGACPGPVSVSSQEAAELLTGYRVHRGALASMARRALPTVTGLLSGALPASDLSRAPLAGDPSGGPLAVGGPAGGGGPPAPGGPPGPGPRRAARLATADRYFGRSCRSWERRWHLPLCGGARRRRGDLVAPVRGSALPTGGQGFYGCRVRYPVRAHVRLARRAGRDPGGRFRAARADTRPVGAAAWQPGGGGPGCAAAGHGGRRAVLPLAGGGRHGGLRADERGCDGAGGRLAERGRGRRDRLPRTGAPARLTRAVRLACSRGAVRGEVLAGVLP